MSDSPLNNKFTHERLNYICSKPVVLDLPIPTYLVPLDSLHYYDIS